MSLQTKLTKFFSVALFQTVLLVTVFGFSDGCLTTGNSVRERVRTEALSLPRTSNRKAAGYLKTCFEKNIIAKADLVYKYFEVACTRELNTTRVMLSKKQRSFPPFPVFYFVPHLGEYFSPGLSITSVLFI